MSAANEGRLQRLVGQRPWRAWPSIWAWLRYVLRWKGWHARMQYNEFHQRGGWKLHDCPDNHPCRASIGGGCARGYCAHYEVQPDDAGVPRFPRSRLVRPNVL